MTLININKKLEQKSCRLQGEAIDTANVKCYYLYKAEINLTEEESQTFILEYALKNKTYLDIEFFEEQHAADILSFESVYDSEDEKKLKFYVVVTWSYYS